MEKTDIKAKLDSYKKNIDLSAYMTSHGFRMMDRSTKDSKRMTNDKTGEMYVVYRKNSEFKYFSPDHDCYKGQSYKGKSVIDFVMERDELAAKIPEGKTFNMGYVCKFLDDYIKSPGYNVPSSQDITDSRIGNGDEEVDFKFFRALNNISYLKDFSFLHSRGITYETAANPLFSPVVHNSLYTSAEGYKFTNTAFLAGNYKNLNTGLSVRNDTLKQKFGNFHDSLVYSFCKSGVSRIAVGESFLDCMSHYQMSKDDGKDKTFYNSTEGAPSPGQMKLIGFAIDKTKAEGLDIIFDNDLAGDKYSLLMLAQIEPESLCRTAADAFSARITGLTDNEAQALARPDFMYHSEMADSKVAVLEFSLPIESGSFDKYKSVYEAAADRMNDKFKFEFSDHEKPFDLKCEDCGIKAKFSLSFKHSQREYWQESFEFVRETKFAGNEFFQRAMPLTDDFNNDLKAKLGINKDFKIVTNRKGNDVAIKLSDEEKIQAGQRIEMLSNEKTKAKLNDRYCLYNPVFKDNGSLEKTLSGINQKVEAQKGAEKTNKGLEM